MVWYTSHALYIFTGVEADLQHGAPLSIAPITNIIGLVPSFRVRYRTPGLLVSPLLQTTMHVI